MSRLSSILKYAAPLADSDASPALLFPLSTATIAPPKPIALADWKALMPDERAPFRSIAMVDMANDRFMAVVIDTAALRPLWRIDAPAKSYAEFHAHMSGDPGTPSRGTMIVSAPNNSQPFEAHPSTSAGGPERAEADCSWCVSAFPTEPREPGGVPDAAFALKVAHLLSVVGHALLVEKDGRPHAEVRRLL